MTWIPVCALASLVPDRGAAALVAGRQVALFRLRETDEVLAVDHRDPFSGANVIARGLVGSRGDVPTVASPVYKQTFDLRTGVCLDDESGALGIWEVRVSQGVVEVRTSDSETEP